jgi:hypothetical protein
LIQIAKHILEFTGVIGWNPNWKIFSQMEGEKDEQERKHSNHKDTITHVLDPHTHVREIMIQSATKERYMRRVHPNP